ncbi:tetratricopeptide repeat protein [Pseudenhygromyxa sp. WMMC2535]|uniref:tetratricopeptide repeat protein n=1 Tax=Pseudenhygromyxa sp. WMMC2535 TaxID=2712867 RepID=UPI0015963B47|nr:tetratricopeptide repeat protein [Pseudenhygromyxa sp. WMMC2535]NVB42705.1 tetratricopeptide repeat protein [Pseudenhygromyxa sp. WMMC2535]
MTSFVLRPIVCSILCSSLALSPVIAQAAPAAGEVAADDKSQAESLSDEAIVAFNDKNYEEAAELFKQAYDLDPEPNYLFNIGRVYEEAGELESAVEYYASFVKQPGVDLDSRQVALDRLKVLRQIIEETKDPEPEASPEPEPEPEPEVAPVTEPPADEGAEEAERKRKVMRGAGFGLVGVGAAALIGGAVAGGLAQGDNRSAADAENIEDRRDLLASSRSKAVAADVLYGVGGALLVAGVVLVVVGYKKPKKSSSRVAFSPSFGPSGAGADLRVRF